jgi:hypothetical protein
MLIATALFAILLVGSAALITWTQRWPAVGEWFVSMGALGVVAWLLVPTVLFSLAGYRALSRATPKG